MQRRGSGGSPAGEAAGCAHCTHSAAHRSQQMLEGGVARVVPANVGSTPCCSARCTCTTGYRALMQTTVRGGWVAR